MKYVVIVIILGYLLFGVFPQKGKPSDDDSIVIEKFVSGKKEPINSVSLNYSEATLLSEDIGYLWCNYFVHNSWEDMPHYWLTINLDGTTQEKIYVSRSEYSTGCRSSDKLIAHLEQRLF